MLAWKLYLALVVLGVQASAVDAEKKSWHAF